MRKPFVALAVVFFVIGSSAFAHAQTCYDDMSPQEALDVLRSGDANESGVVVCEQLVKNDIKTCLLHYEPDKCMGTAAEWLNRWNALELQQLTPPSTVETTISHLSTSLRLLRPSLGDLQVPFAKSAADYFPERSFPLVPTR